MAVGKVVILTFVAHVDIFPHPSFTVQVIMDKPGLNNPLASLPEPLRVVAPVTWNDIFKAGVAVQLSVAVNTGIV